MPAGLTLHNGKERGIDTLHHNGSENQGTVPKTVALTKPQPQRYDSVQIGVLIVDGA
jgi:hypothetical protein